MGRLLQCSPATSPGLCHKTKREGIYLNERSWCSTVLHGYDLSAYSSGTALGTPLAYILMYLYVPNMCQKGSSKSSKRITWGPGKFIKVILPSYLRRHGVLTPCVFVDDSDYATTTTTLTAATTQLRNYATIRDYATNTDTSTTRLCGLRAAGR